MHYQCAACSVEFVSNDVQVDHTSPVVEPSKGFISWDVYVDRLFCEKDNLQVLCLNCHKKKSATEKLLRTKKK
jgi:5-methylcytosine-specific restriction endonuclease McrA